MSYGDDYYEQGNKARATIAGFVAASADELADLGFTAGGVDWPNMASCDECSALVPCKAGDIVADPVAPARQHRTKCPRDV